MRRFRFYGCLALAAFVISTCPNYASAWYDETHVAIAKAAGYYKWFNAAAADLAKKKLERLRGVMTWSVFRQDQRDFRDLLLYFSLPGGKRENTIWLRQKKGPASPHPPF